MSEGRRYLVHEAIGQGGFGTVYRAQMSGEGGFTREVALKVLNPDVQGVDEIAARLRDEARILGLVQHRAVVRVDGLVKLADRWSVVMEYVHGVDLLRLIMNGRVPVGPALEIVGEVAGALHVAFFTEGEAGPLFLLHRDIKPANIHLTLHGEVRVLDFGGARAEFESREANSEVLRFGSMGYMSPERLDLIDGVEGDAYSLGVVLYELIVGMKVGRASSNRERFEERLAELMEEARNALGPDHAEVVELLGALMSFEPGERPLHRETERRCRELSRRLEGPSLRDWSEGVVPGLLEETRAYELGDLSGSTLSEQTGEIERNASLVGAQAKGGKTEDTWSWQVPQEVLDEESFALAPDDWKPGGERRRLVGVGGADWRWFFAWPPSSGEARSEGMLSRRRVRQSPPLPKNWEQGRRPLLSPMELASPHLWSPRQASPHLWSPRVDPLGFRDRCPRRPRWQGRALHHWSPGSRP